MSYEEGGPILVALRPINGTSPARFWPLIRLARTGVSQAERAGRVSLPHYILHARLCVGGRMALVSQRVNYRQNSS
jgi:hypothetical protein